VCQTQPVDCILLDYRLPDLDGLEFLQALGRQASMLPCPVVMLTGFGSEVLAAYAMKAGAMDYVPKNVPTSKSLERAITNVVERFKLRRAVEEQRRLLKQTIQELRRRNEEIRSFCHVLPPSLPRVMVDEKRLAQVLSNLLSNALKFTPEAGQILVTAAQDPHKPAYIVVSVSDTGQGIPPEQCRLIFERLYQVRSETIGNGGLGLGLYICRELIKLHGGDIWADSTLGQGSTFSFTVPTVVAKERGGDLRQEC
jgi:signal transduction histidine kinase